MKNDYRVYIDNLTPEGSRYAYAFLEAALGIYQERYEKTAVDPVPEVLRDWGVFPYLPPGDSEERIGSDKPTTRKDS